MNSVFPSSPPSMQAKQLRSSSIVCSTCPPSRTRTQVGLPSFVGELPTAEKIEVTTVDVGVTTTVHHNLVPAPCEATQVSMDHQRPVWLPTQEKRLGARYDKQAPIGQPVDGERDRGWDTGDYLAVALDIDGDDLLRAPVREPQTTLMPTRRLADHKTA